MVKVKKKIKKNKKNGIVLNRPRLVLSQMLIF
jgi:hypothetical protein